jgi:Leucine-rich repeat (LRR) protein
MTLWLVPHIHLIDHLKVDIRIFDHGDLALRELCEAAAPCRSLALSVTHIPALDLAHLAAVAHSLHELDVTADQFPHVRGFSTISGLSQLTCLSMSHASLPDQDPWAVLAEMTNLKNLSLAVYAYGDPSALSALIGLTSLQLTTRPGQQDWNGVPFYSLSSLQPLSRLQQLEVLHLEGCCRNVTSLHDLAGLSKLSKLDLIHMTALESLQGVSTAVTELRIAKAKGLGSLVELSPLVLLEKLALHHCGITSLAPLASGLSKLKSLDILNCPVTSMAGLHGPTLGTCLQSLSLMFCNDLRDLSGIEELQALLEVDISLCGGISSLQPIGKLGNRLQKLWVKGCDTAGDEVLQLPHVQPTADVWLKNMNVREVVLAGGSVVKCDKNGVYRAGVRNM